MKISLFSLLLFCLSYQVLFAQKPELVLPIGHQLGISSVEFSPDGKYVLTASEDQTAKIWNAKNWQLLHSLDGHTATVSTAKYSPNGKTIITASEELTVKVWDSQTGNLLHNLEGHNQKVTTASYSNDGNSILTTSYDNTASIWDTETGKLVHQLEGHKNGVIYGTFSPDGNTIVTTSYKEVILWDATSGKQLKVLKRHKQYVNMAKFSPNGERVLTVSDDGTAKVWHTKSGKLLYTLERSKQKLLSAKYSPNGKTILTITANRTAKVWDAESRKLLFSLNGHISSINSAIYNPDGQEIIAAFDNDSIKIMSVESQQIRSTLKGNHGDDVNIINFSSDGKNIIFGTNYRQLKIIDYYSGSILNTVSLYRPKKIGFSATAAYSPDGERIILNSYNYIKIIDAINGKTLYSLEDDTDYGTYGKFSPDSKSIITASNYDPIKVWDVESGNYIHSFEDQDLTYNSASYSPDGSRIMTISNDSIFNIWDSESKKHLHSWNGNRTKYISAEYSPNSKRIIAVSEDYTVQIWDPNSKLLLHTMYDELFLSATFSPDGKTILTGSASKYAQTWDVESGALLQTFDDHRSLVNSAKYSPNGKMIVTASRDHTAKVWDADIGVLLHTLKGHTQNVESAIFSPDGKTIITTSWDGSIILWDAQTGEKLVQHYILLDKETITLGKNGLFNATPGVLEELYFVNGLEIIPLEAYFEQFYRPNLWERVMNGEEIEKASFDFENQKPAPDIEIIDDEMDNRGAGLLSTADNIFNLNVQMTDRGGGIDDVHVFQNGKLVESENININLKDETINKTFQIDLVSGINELKVTAFNFQRTGKSEEITIALTGEIQQVSNLYLFAIGINEYEKSSYNLNYAVPDADAFVTGVENFSKDIFGKVEVVKLTDSHATKQGISNAFNIIKEKAQQTDVFVFYYAGHGSMSIAKKNEKPVFYLLPHEITEMYNPETLESSAISANSLMEFSKDIKAQKQLFVLDACQSGGAVDMLASRGAVEERAIALLARSTGTYFLTASGSEQYASELSSLGHGVFTYALLQGLSGEADAAKDNNVTVEELLPFVKNTVPELSEKHKGAKQYPVSYGFGQDFPMVVSGIVEINNETKIPKGKYDGHSIEELEKMKKEAIENEDYEMAAEIRDEIKNR